MEFNKWDFLQISLGVLFVGLKLAGIIQWSWWLVLLPFYAVLALVLALALAITVFAGIVGRSKWLKFYFKRINTKEKLK